MARGTAHKLRIAAAMEGRRNNLNAAFAEELCDQFSADPEVVAWIQQHQKELNSPNEDGSLPYGESRMERRDRAVLVQLHGSSAHGEGVWSANEWQ